MSAPAKSTPLATSTPSSTTPIPTKPPSSEPPTFDFPREYHFPPFFTLQTNHATLRSQQEKWSSLILSYCRYHRIYRITLSYTDTAHEDLFHNRRLSRSLRLSDAREILKFMQKEGRAEPVDSGSNSSSGGGGGELFWIYWRTPEEWAAMVEEWVEETAQKGAVLTLYELTEGEGTRGTEFHGLDPELLQKALQVLVKRGKAQIFGQEDQQGIKFF